MATWTFRPAVREQIRLLLGLAGPSGSGKTYTGMRLAKGLSGSKRFAVIDTENHRASMYADQFDFDVCDLSAPYRPDAYSAAIETADKAGYEAILVDSMSHEHAGEGGVLDWQEEILSELVKRAVSRGDNRREWELEEAYKRSAWIDPKSAHKRMIEKMLQCRAHLIFCMRAEDKIDFKKDEQGKTRVVPMETLSGFKGWIPICDKRFLFELTTSFIFLPDRPGVPVPIKLQSQHQKFFPLDKPVTEECGRLMGEWAHGGSPKATTPMVMPLNGKTGERVPRPEPPPVRETKPGVYETKPADKVLKLLKDIEACPSLERLTLYAEQCKDKDIPEGDRGMLREVWAARRKQLQNPQPPQPADEAVNNRVVDTPTGPASQAEELVTVPEEDDLPI